ncbi:MAG: hypothetical protein ACI936_000470 [Paraglaciecola sp.]|jgi:hypothetical protein
MDTVPLAKNTNEIHTLTVLFLCRHEDNGT